MDPGPGGTQEVALQNLNRFYSSEKNQAGMTIAVGAVILAIGLFTKRTWLSAIGIVTMGFGAVRMGNADTYRQKRDELQRGMTIAENVTLPSAATNALVPPPQSQGWRPKL